MEIINSYHLPNGKTFTQKVCLQTSCINGAATFRLVWIVRSSQGRLLQVGTTARDTLDEAMEALSEELDYALEFA